MRESPAPDRDDLEEGMRHAFRKAALLRKPTCLEAIERATGARSRVQLRDPEEAGAGEFRIPELERWSIERGESRFEVLDEISRGDDGVVLRARDRDLGRHVALKVLREEQAADGAALSRFFDEARIGGQLQHPGILPVYGVGVGADSRPFLALMLPRGRTLGELIGKGEGRNGGRRGLLTVLEQVCQALAYAHARGVVHGGVSLESVMVGPFGEVLVTEWGQAVFGGDPGADVRALGGLLEAVLADEADEELDEIRRRCISTPDEGGLQNASGVARELGAVLSAREERARRAEVAAAAERARAEAERTTAERERRQADRARHARLRSLAVAAVVLVAVATAGTVAALQVAEERTATENAEAAFSDAMREAARHEGARDWAEATAFARKALALAEILGPDGEEAARARAAMDRIARAERVIEEDAEALRRLDELRARLVKRFVEPAVRDDAYRVAFLHCGIDVNDTTEGAAAAILARSVPVELTSALDEWALFRRRRSDEPDSDWKHLLEIARAADPDEWRNRLRDAVVELDADEVLALAESADAGLLPTRTIHLLAKLLGAAGGLEAATDVLRRGLHRHPQDASLLEMLARCLKAHRPARHEEAVSCYLQALAVLPDSFYLWSGIGVVLGDLGEFDDSVAAFRRARELDPASALPVMDIGVARFKQGRLDEAIAAFRESLEIEPTAYKTWMNLGVALNRVEKRGEALEALRKAHELKPDELMVNFNLGLQHYGNDDAVGAIPYLRRATELAPKHIPSRVMLGVVLTGAGEHEAAVAVYEATLAFKPDAVGVLHNLAMIHSTGADERLHDHEKAVEYAERAVRKRDHPDQWQVLGRARYLVGRYEAAIEAAEKALPTGGRPRPECLLVLAGSHARLGHAEEARSWLAKADAWFEEHPPDEDLQRLRSEVEAALGEEAR